MSDTHLTDVESDLAASHAYDRDIDRRMTSLETKWDAVIPTLATKADLAELRSEMQKSFGEAHRWMIGIAIGLVVGYGGLYMTLVSTLKAPAVAQLQPPTPIVIYLPPPGQAPTAPAR